MTSIDVGVVRELNRYPVKSMAGVPSTSVAVGWHGVAGDRRLAFRRVGADGGFPWLSASRFPEMLTYRPVGVGDGTEESLPTHVELPDGTRFEVGSAALDAHVSERYGKPVELTHLKHGVFDEAAMSVIDAATIEGIGREAGLALDPRRFRANVVVESEDGALFREDAWAGGRLLLGDEDDGAIVSVTLRDYRCVMINMDPDTVEKDARVMKTVLRLNEGFAGVYGTVVRAGVVHVGDRVRLLEST